MWSGSVDPAQTAYYAWTALLSSACLYNLTILVVRAAFQELQDDYFHLWLTLDYTCDFLYIIDCFVSSRKGYLDDGVMVDNPMLLSMHYLKSREFMIDIFSLLPTDLLYISGIFQPLFRILKLIALIFIVFHWNGCLFYFLSEEYEIGPNSDRWVFSYSKILNPRFPTCDVLLDVNCKRSYLSRSISNPSLLCKQHIDRSAMHTCVGGEASGCAMEVVFSNLTRQYMFSFYWSALILTTIGEQMPPVEMGQFLFVILDILLGLLIFATIVGNVGAMVTQMNAQSSEFSERLDGVKAWMAYRGVEASLQRNVIAWFAYIRAQKQALDEESTLAVLPSKLKAQLAIHVHLSTLSKVKLFQDCEPGLLVELVLKLRLQIYSPNDYICRKGDVGKEMYIVKTGFLDVVSEDGKKVFVTLKAGSVVGELSIMDIPGAKNGNKRTASIRSQGYTDLFVLSKDDLWDALREYPDAKQILLQKGKEILQKDGLLNADAEDEDAMGGKTMEQRLNNVDRVLQVLERNLQKAKEDLDAKSISRKQRLAKLEEALL